MKLADIINKPLGWTGLKLVRLSTLKKLQEHGPAHISKIADIENDKPFLDIYNKVKDYSMVGIERSYALYRAVKYIISNHIEGDFAECGVWKGGSCMLIAYTLATAGADDRKIFLYDTFDGMTRPGPDDGKWERVEWEKYKIAEDRSSWGASPVEEAQKNMFQTGYRKENIVFIKGKVEETIPRHLPSRIALLRLDTDWYASTRHELIHLFPLLEKRGVLIIDDYGKWEGARKATDEYFGDSVFLNRIDETGRLLIK